MTVQDTTSYRYYQADGTTTEWSAPPAFEDEDLVVFVMNGAARTDLVLGADYTVLDAGLATIRIVTTAAVASGRQIWIYRRLKREQLSAYTETGKFPALTVETDFDRAVLMIAELAEQLTRAMQLDESTPPDQRNVTFPPAELGRVIGWVTGPKLGNLDLPAAPGGLGGSDFGLTFDGSAQAAALEAKIAEEIAAGRDRMIIAPPADVASPILHLDRLVRIENFARPFVLEARGFAFRYGPDAELRSNGREAELPAVGKARLWADVDVSGGAVTAFDIDVAGNPGIVALLTVGARVRVRGQNGADGDALPGYLHEDTVAGLVQVSANRYTLTLTDGLPDTVPGDIWRRDWDGSAWNPSVGGPAVDQTLISVLVEMVLDQEVSDTAIIPVPAGYDAETALPVGSWVVAQSNARCSDLLAVSASDELVTRQMARVEAHDTELGLVLLDRVIDGTLYLTVNAVNQRPRLTLVEPCIEPTVIMDPAHPVQVTGTVAPPPARRRHIVQHRYAIRPRTFDVRLYGAGNASDVHGAVVREHVCADGYGARCVRFDAHHKATGGSGNGVWLKNSSGSLYEHCLMVRCRHGLTDGGGSGTTFRHNVVADSWESAIDTGHGEGGANVSAIGNHVFAGRPAADRPAIKGIEVSNNSSLFGDDGSVIDGNHFYNFDGADAAAVVCRSGARGARIGPGNHLHGACGIGVSLKIDRRAPLQGISDILITGDLGTGGILIDGRAPAWATETLFNGSASRPTYCEGLGGSLWSTTQSGTSGPDIPDPGAEPVVGTTTHNDGTIIWTYRGNVATPISDITVKGVSIDGAALPIQARRVSGLKVLDSLVAGDAAIKLLDAPGARFRRLFLEIGGAGIGDWLVDEGNNGGTRYSDIDANGGGVDDTGGSDIQSDDPTGGTSNALTALVSTTVKITADGAVIPRSARQFTAAAGVAYETDVEILLASAGRVNLPKTAVVGDKWLVMAAPGSEPITLDFEDSTDDDPVGAPVATVGHFDLAKPLVLAPSGRVLVKVISVDSETGVIYAETEGPIVGRPSYLHGPLEGVPDGTTPPPLSDFNSLAEESRSEAGNFTFAAADAGKVVRVTGASTASIPANATTAFPVGTVLTVYVDTASTVTLAIATDTLRPAPGLTLSAAGQYAHVGARKRSATEWVAIGQFAAS